MLNERCQNIISIALVKSQKFLPTLMHYTRNTADGLNVQTVPAKLRQLSFILRNKSLLLLRQLTKVIAALKARPFVLLVALLILGGAVIGVSVGFEAPADVCHAPPSLVDAPCAVEAVEAAAPQKGRAPEPGGTDYRCRLNDPEYTRRYVHEVLARRDREAKKASEFWSWYNSTQWTLHGVDVRRQVNRCMYPVLPRDFPECADLLARYYSGRRAAYFRAAYDNGMIANDSFLPDPPC